MVFSCNTSRDRPRRFFSQFTYSRPSQRSCAAKDRTVCIGYYVVVFKVLPARVRLVSLRFFVVPGSEGV